MKKKVFCFYMVCLFLTGTADVFAERERFVEENGRVVIEAENYHRQFRMGIFRHWYTLPEINRTPEPNPDPFHSGASGGKYLKALPFTRVTPEDSIIENLNFFAEGNQAPRLEYDVLINDPGRYYVWVRAYPTGSENNSIHVGYNDIWPETGKAVQWCGSSGWTWSGNRKLDDNPCGSRNGAYLDLPEGPSTIIFSMREDGFEFDKFILVKDPEYTPSGTGPAESTIINRCQDGVDNNGNGLIDCDDPVCMIYNECRLPLKGRIAISSDGNGGDPDDIGASATMFAILSSQNLKHKLVHKDYGNDMKGINEDVWVEMKKTMVEGIELFDLNPDVFFNDQEDFNGAVDNLRKEINKSSMSDPLTIIHAGSLSVIGEAIQQAEPKKRKYATVISHSWWNDYNHASAYDDFYYEDVVGIVKDDLIELGVQWIQIMDQNWHLHTKRDGTPWTFLRDADDPRLNWIHERIVTARDIMWTKYDISDAGMLYFAITGDEVVTPQKLREMLVPPPPPPDERGMAGYWGFNNLVENLGEDGSDNGNDLSIINTASLAGGKYGQGLFLPDDSQSYLVRENNILSNNFPAAFPGELADELTMAAWINISKLDSDDRSPIFNKESLGGNRGFTLDVRKPGYLHFQVSKDNANTTKTSDFPGDRTPILPGNWYHVAVSYKYVEDGNSIIKLYVNGETELTVNTSVGPIQNNISPFEIGAYNYTGTYQRYFMGMIDEAYVFNQFLPDTEIIKIMNADSPPLSSGHMPEMSGFLNYYPNPAGDNINIAFQVSKATNVELKIYNIQGQKVNSFINQVMAPGSYNRNFNISGLPEGLYLLRLQAGDKVETGKLSVLNDN